METPEVEHQISEMITEWQEKYGEDMFAGTCSICKKEAQ